MEGGIYNNKTASQSTTHIVSIIGWDTFTQMVMIIMYHIGLYVIHGDNIGVKWVIFVSEWDPIY